jgi:uncharacterized membrane protein
MRPAAAPPNPSSPAPGRHRPFRTALLRGLGVLLPPLLTIVIVVWICQTVKFYVLEPVTTETRDVLAWWLADVRDELPNAKATEQYEVYLSGDRAFRLLDDGHYVPLEAYMTALRGAGSAPPPTTGIGVYRRYVETTYLRPIIVIPVFSVFFLAVMYVLGSLFAAGIGRALWEYFESVINQLPLVRSIYGAAKQVTDYMLTEKSLEFKRVIAFEHPAAGMWQIGFVASEGFREIRRLAGEPVLAVLVHVNPVPVSGYIRMVPKSQVLDLDMTVDQAVHYIVSFGVVLPPQQLPLLRPSNSSVERDEAK